MRPRMIRLAPRWGSGDSDVRFTPINARVPKTRRIESQIIGREGSSDSPEADAVRRVVVRARGIAASSHFRLRQLAPSNGHAVQLRPTALTVNAGAQRPPPERYHGSIGTRCWASAASA